MPKIFISYRREDTQTTANRLYDLLEAHYGEDDEENVFLDVDSIPLGHNFTEYLEDKVDQCDVLLSLIGRKWLTAINEKGKSHLKDGDDFVRIEILRGLKLEKIVIPTLVHGADMPEANSMPKELDEFSQMQAARLRQGSRFKEDVDRLIEQIDSRHIDALRQEEEEMRKEEASYKKKRTAETLEKVIREAIGKAEGKLTHADLGEIKELCMEDCDGDVDFSSGRLHLPSEQAPSFFDEGPLDLSILSKLTELRKLELGDVDCADLTPLSNLGGLNKLSIGGNRYYYTEVDCLHSTLKTPLDLTPLASLGHAHKFEWRSSDRELKPYFKKYDKLFARELGSIGSSNYRRLKDEEKAELSELAELLKDARSEGLSELCLNDHGIMELAPLAGIISLSELLLNRNAIVDLFPLSNLQNLGKLELNKNQIEYLAPLSFLKNLYWLELAGNKLSDLGPLGCIKELGYLNLSNNNITDLGPLAKLDVEWILLRENKISDLRPLRRRR